MSAVDQSETTVGGGLSWKTKSPWRITFVTHQGLQLHEPDADEPLSWPAAGIPGWSA
jgi:hypothetical protein